MADIVSPALRSKMMAGIRNKNTKPELIIRSGLHSRGFRFRLRSSGMPGKPDLVFPKYKAVIFVNGCFWHGHDCHLFRLPSTATDFWSEKISKNRTRDEKNRNQLQQTGWRTMTIWECALKGKNRLPHDGLMEEISKWLHSTSINLEIQGVEHDK
jgi:DNA mismatch endonuclease (patch repair protein)